MARHGQRPAKGPVASAIALFLLAALVGCSASSGRPASPAPDHSAGPAAATAKAIGAAAITIAGDLPVPGNGSQDAETQTRAGRCDSYVIRDSYGFPAGDTLAGFGAP